MLKMRDPGRARSRRQVTDALDRAGIKSFCLYGLFGYYDFMLRVWSRSEWRSRLVEEIEVARSDFVAIREMRVDEVSYWAQQRPGAMTPDDLASHLEDNWSTVEEICRADAEGRLTNPSSARDSAMALLNEGQLLFLVPPVNVRTIKFYIALFGYGITTLDLVAMTTIFEIDSVQVEGISAYKGAGFAQILVKGIVKSTSELSDFASALSDWGSEFGLHTETFIIDPRDVYEADTIDSVLQGSRSIEVTRLMRIGHGRFDALTAGRQPDEVEAIAKAFDKFSTLLLPDPELKELALELVEASLADDAWKITSALRFLQEIEGRFRDLLLRQLLPETFGANWYDNELLRPEVPGREGSTPGHWTWHDCIVVAKQAYRSDPQFGAEVSTNLGPDGLATMQRLVPIRNVVAHGKLFEVRTPALPLMSGPRPVLDLDVLLEGLVLLGRLRTTSSGIQNRAEDGDGHPDRS